MNCHLNHSSFYRGCKIFQQLKLELNQPKANPNEVYQKLKSALPNNSQPTSNLSTSNPSYSEAIKKDDILEKLEKIAQTQGDCLTKQNENFTEQIHTSKNSTHTILMWEMVL